MKPGTLLAISGLLLTSGGIAAQDLDRTLTYRDSDPFLFCEQGQDIRKAPLRCWMPVYPFTGSFVVLPHCQPINPYGKTWSSDDTNSFRQYLTVCPVGQQPGGWNGPGRKDMTPHQH